MNAQQTRGFGNVAVRLLKCALDQQFLGFGNVEGQRGNAILLQSRTAGRHDGAGSGQLKMPQSDGAAATLD